MVKSKNELVVDAAAERKAAADAKANAAKKLEVIELGHKKIKEREAKKKADFEARKKEVLKEETELIERIDLDDLSDKDLVKLKRMKTRIISETKMMEARERAEVEKTFKVHVGDAKTPCKIVKAKSKNEAVKETDGATRAFEVADNYTVPTAAVGG